MTEANSFCMPTVLVTGANRGIGLSFCKHYKQKGWTVIGTARQPEAASALQSLGIEILPLDISQEASIQHFCSSFSQNNRSNQQIDLLINNAGILRRTNTPGDILEQFQVNALGPLLLTQGLSKHLDDGRVVFITSSMGSIGENSSGGYMGYRASKTALNMFVKTLSIDAPFPVLALHPGYIKTDMTGMNGDMGPDEAVERMAVVIDGFNKSMSGEFRHRDGRIISW